MRKVLSRLICSPYSRWASSIQRTKVRVEEGIRGGVNVVFELTELQPK